MDNTAITEQLRKLIREEIDSILAETLTSSSIGKKDGVETHAISKDGAKVGYVKTDGKATVGRIGPKAAVKPLDEAEAEEVPSKPSKKKSKKSKEEEARDIGQKEMFDESINELSPEVIRRAAEKQVGKAMTPQSTDPYTLIRQALDKFKAVHAKDVKEGNPLNKAKKNAEVARRGRGVDSIGMSPSDAKGQSDREAKQASRYSTNRTNTDPLGHKTRGDGFRPARDGEAYDRRDMGDKPSLPEQKYTMNEILEMIKNGGLK